MRSMIAKDDLPATAWPLPSHAVASISATKGQGNSHFKAKRFKEAADSYDAAIKQSKEEGVEMRTWPEVDLLVVACHANLAMALLRLDKHAQALEACNNGLAMSSADVHEGIYKKLLIRRVCALEGLGKFDEAAGQLLALPGLALSADGLAEIAGRLEKEGDEEDAGKPTLAMSIEASFSRRPQPATALSEILCALVGLFRGGEMPEAMDTNAPNFLRSHMRGETGGLMRGVNINARDGHGNSLLLGCCDMLSGTHAAQGQEQRLAATATAEEEEEGAPTTSPLEGLLQVLVVEHGADVNQRRRMAAGYDKSETDPGTFATPLMLCSRHFFASGIRFLLAHGADPTLRDGAGFTALQVVCAGNEIDRAEERAGAVKAFVEHRAVAIDAYINYQNRLGSTALHLSAMNGHPQVAVLLLAAGARTHLLNDLAHDPLSLSLCLGRSGKTNPNSRANQLHERSWSVAALLVRHQHQQHQPGALSSTTTREPPLLSETVMAVRLRTFVGILADVNNSTHSTAGREPPGTPEGFAAEARQRRDVVQALMECCGISFGRFPRPGQSSSNRLDLVAVRNSCASCGNAPGTLRCSRCGVAKYCSKACQKMDWRRKEKGYKGGGGHAQRCEWIVDQQMLGLLPRPGATAAWEAAAAGDDRLQDNILCEVSAALAKLLPPVTQKAIDTDTDPALTDFHDRAALIVASKHMAAGATDSDDPSSASSWWARGNHKWFDDNLSRRPDAQPTSTIRVSNALFCTDGPTPTWMSSVYAPLSQQFAFAVPTEEVLEIVASLGKPVVEVGAGTGYWSWLLRNRGVDVIAYDAHDPSRGTDANRFVDSAYTEIIEADCASLFEKKKDGGPVGASGAVHADLALLCCFTWCDEMMKLGVNKWDFECLQGFGGDLVIFVGVWNIGPMAVAECETKTASLEFQQYLLDNFHVEQRVLLPRLGGDTAVTLPVEFSIWKRGKPPASAKGDKEEDEVEDEDA